MASLLIHRNFYLLDGYMNIVMTQTEQYVNGQLKINIDVISIRYSMMADRTDKMRNGTQILNK
ncbi:hypothetical protein YC2023_047824 [Brassica napus]